MKRILLIAMCGVTIFSSKDASAQREQNEVVITTGVGYSIGMALFKGVLNTALRESNLNEIRGTPIINGMVDYGINENFSIGGAVSFHQWNWDDRYTDTSGVTTTGSVSASRANIGLRGLFHFGSNERMDMYAGARIGYSLWRTKSNFSDSNGQSASDFSAPAGIFGAQALFGMRAYFNEVIGANIEIGIGTAPYFLSGGLSFRI